MVRYCEAVSACRPQMVTRNQVVESSGVFAAGQLVVTSDPTGAEVVLGGKTAGTTPLTLTDVQ